MKVCYTCNDSINAMVRDEVCITINSHEEADQMWDRAKAIFCRRYHTKKQFVSITAVRYVPDNYKPVR